MKRNKKNNIFLKLTMIFAMFAFIASPFYVYADGSLGLDEGLEVEPNTTCKAGTEYTVYYLFLDAQDEHHSGTSSTMKNFNAGKKKAGDKIKSAGIIDVLKSGGSDDATNKSKWSYNTFFTKFNQAVSNTSTYVYGANTSNVYAMSTIWFKANGQEMNSNAAAGLQVSQLSSAAVDSNALTSTKFEGFVVGYQMASTNIIRNYSNWGSVYPTADGPQTVALENDPNWQCYFHPYVAYVSLCEADTSQSQNPENPSTEYVTLTYIENAGSDTVENMPNPKADKKEKTKSFTISENIPERTGYQFKGWATSASGTVKYTPGQSLGKLSSDTKVYAVWEKVPAGGFKLDYNPNGGMNAPLGETANAGECIVISSEEPNNSGSKFLGWATKPTATAADPDYKAGKKYCGPKDLTLYAVWSGSAATSNPKTGVADYAIAFGLIGAAAGSGLLISKRKKLFKQI